MSTIYRSQPAKGQKGLPPIEKIVVGARPTELARTKAGERVRQPVKGWEPPVIEKVMASDGLTREQAIALCVDWKPEPAKAPAKDEQKGAKA